jgi:hypothetical protein
MYTKFLSEDLMERNHQRDLGVVGKIILERISKKWGGEDVDWIHLAQDRDQWRDFVKREMNFRVP